MPIIGVIDSAKTGRLSTTAYESIMTAVGTGSSGSIVFSGIPSTYTHLQIRGIGRTNFAAANIQLSMRFNGDTGGTYSTHNMYNTGSGTGVAGQVLSTTYVEGGQMAGGNLTTNVMGLTIIDILDYKNTNKYKTTRAISGNNNNGGGIFIYSSGTWQSNVAINSITLNAGAGNWTTTTQFALYGIKG
jgi:hypothetical protein